MSSHAIKPIPVVTAYFARHYASAVIPVVAETYKPDVGWKRHPWRKRISGNYARRLRAEGVTRVGLSIPASGVADFDIKELAGGSR